MRVLVCGSRQFSNPFEVSLAIDKLIAGLPEGAIVMHGTANGADSMAEEAALRHGHSVARYKADWENAGKRAGYLRNIQMLDEKPDMVLAFWNGESKGTQHTFEEAMRRGIQTAIYKFPA